jgi:hypothetical protein
MPYTPKQIGALLLHQEEVLKALERLVYSSFQQSANIENPHARSHLLHGACRRLNTMRRCIVRIFELFPPSQESPLSRIALNDVQIYLQAFVINVSGVLDNWAWAFVLRHGLEKDFAPPNVSLFKEQTQRVLPTEFSKYLTSEKIQKWHTTYLKEERDALAHRIPLYVPPAALTPNDVEKHQQLETERMDAAERQDWGRVDELIDEQGSLGTAANVFTGDFVTQRPSVVFHPQIIADCLTVDEGAGCSTTSGRTVLRGKPTLYPSSTGVGRQNSRHAAPHRLRAGDRRPRVPSAGYERVITRRQPATLQARDERRLAALQHWRKSSIDATEA